MRRIGKRLPPGPAGRTDRYQAALVDLASSVADGRYATAIELGESLMRRDSYANDLGRIQYFVGTANLYLAHFERAESLLAQAHSRLEALNDGVLLAECLGSEASLANLTQRPNALALAEEALSACRRLEHVPPATEARLLSIVASAHTANFEWDRAIELFEAAVEAAGSQVDLRRLARTYSDLAAAYLVTDQLDAAINCATRSVALLETLGDKVSLARSENNLGMVLTKRHDFGAARQHLNRSLEICRELDLQAGRSHLLLSLSELCLEEGDIQQSKAWANDALDLAEHLGESGNVATIRMWLGRIAEKAGDPDATDREFELAIRGFETSGLSEPLLQCHAIYAEIHERRGDLPNAFIHMKKALLGAHPAPSRGS